MMNELTLKDLLVKMKDYSREDNEKVKKAKVQSIIDSIVLRH